MQCDVLNLVVENGKLNVSKKVFALQDVHEAALSRNGGSCARGCQMQEVSAREMRCEKSVSETVMNVIHYDT